MAGVEGRGHPPKPPDPHDGGLGAISNGDGDANPNRRVLPTMSYANAVSSSKASGYAPRAPYKQRFPAISLPARQVGTKEGRPAISFSGPEVDACAKRFQFSLIAKFTVGRPTIAEIQKAFQGAWSIGGRATISPIWDARHVLIILDSEEDVRIALSSRLHKVCHAFFRLFRWYSEYSPKKECKFSSVWVRLPGLPLTLYDTSFVEAIVSTFGYFVAVDDRTKACVAVQYARACVELDVTVAVPDSVWISLPNNNGYWQAIEVETKMAYCSKCRMHGHTLSTCRKATKNVVTVGKRGTEKGVDDHRGNVPDRVGINDVTESGANQEEWMKVMSKRDKAKKKNKGSSTLVMGSKHGQLDVSVSVGDKGLLVRPKYQAVRGVYVPRATAVVTKVGEEATDTDGLEMVIYGETSKEVTPDRDMAAHEVSFPLEDSSGALRSIEDSGQLDDFVKEDSSKEKEGFCSKEGDEPDTRYVTSRKKKLPKGSKHCRSDNA